MKNSESKYIGCFAGLALGDSLGAPHEGGPIERALWRIIGKTTGGRLRYTDDTQMAMDLSISFIKNGHINQEHLAKEFAASYRWSRGYGPGAAKVLKAVRKGVPWYKANTLKYKDGSYGNGAAMRAPIVALCNMKNIEAVYGATFKVSEVTHCHPLAIEGAQLVAAATSMALLDIPGDQVIASLSGLCVSKEYDEKLRKCSSLFQRKYDAKLQEVKKELGSDIVATNSCVTAIYFAARYFDKPFSEMLSEIFRLSGDADTIAAMAGAIWGAKNGIDRIDRCITEVEDGEEIIKMAKTLHELSWLN